MLKLDTPIVKFLELSNQNPDKYRAVEFISKNLKSKSPFFAAFSEEFISEILYIANIRFYEKGQVIFYPDDICDITSIVIYGVLR